MVLREVTICHFSVSSMRARHSDEPDLAREQIEQILLVSRRNNEAAEITGVLLFSDTNFSQALEGPRAESSASTRPLTTTAPQGPTSSVERTAGCAAVPGLVMAYIGPNQWAKQAAGPPSHEPAGARRLLALMGQTLNRG